MWRSLKQPTSALAALFVIGMAACVDLNVVNPDDPDTGRVIRTAGDVESLVSGAYSRWIRVLCYDGPTMMMSNASGEHVAPWGNRAREPDARSRRARTR